MTLAIYTHADCLNHRPGPDADFAPSRLMAVETALRQLPQDNLSWRTAAPATPEDLRSIHTKKHVDAILDPIPSGTTRRFGPDTKATAGTASALLAAAGLALQATADVVGDNIRQAFCLCSPGGHHAETEHISGFCFVNHIALAATRAQQLGIKRVAVIDIDAHHGNGTQAMFWNHPDRLLISLHEKNGLSGFAHETGCDGNILNIQLPHGTGGKGYLNALHHQALPKLHAFTPDMLFVSAGFDTHRHDPLGRLNLETEDYHTIGQLLAQQASHLCQGRLVSVLEGGYDLDHLGSSAAAYIKGLND